MPRESIPSPAVNSDYECVELITSTGGASNFRPTVHLVFSPFLQENIQLNRCFSLGKSLKQTGYLTDLGLPSLGRFRVGLSIGYTVS